MQTYKHGSSVQVGSRDISKHEAANDATDGDKFWCSWPAVGQGRAFKSKHMNKQEKFFQMAIFDILGRFQDLTVPYTHNIYSMNQILFGVTNIDPWL